MDDHVAHGDHMGFRFRKSIRIMPGVRLNFSNRGTSVSLGSRGATVNISDRGVRKTIGLPGTGLSYTTFDRWSGERATNGDGRPVSSGAAGGTWTVLGIVLGLVVGFGGAPVAGVLLSVAGVAIDLLTRPGMPRGRIVQAEVDRSAPAVDFEPASLVRALEDERDALLRQPRSHRHAARLQEIESELRSLEGVRP